MDTFKNYTRYMFCCFTLCCFLPASATSTTPALKNVYFDAATVQQQPRFEIFPLCQLLYASACVFVCAIEPRIQQQALPVGTTAVHKCRDTKRAVQLIPVPWSTFFFVLCTVCGWCVSVYQTVLQAFCTSWQPQQPHFRVVPL